MACSNFLGILLIGTCLHIHKSSRSPPVALPATAFSIMDAGLDEYDDGTNEARKNNAQSGQARGGTSDSNPLRSLFAPLPGECQARELSWGDPG